MTESAFQSKLLKALRARLPQAVIFKHSDRFNSGVPDFSVTLYGLTTWFELKVAPRRCTKIQLYYLARLQRSWIVNLLSDGTIFFGDSKAHTPMLPFNEAVECLVQGCMK